MSSATDVVSLTAMKAHLRYPNPSSASADDDALTDMIATAVDVLSFHCDDILPTLYDEQYDGGSCSIFLRHKPLHEILSVVDVAGMVAYDLEPQQVHAVQVDSQGSDGGSNASGIYSYSVDDYSEAIITKRTIGNAPVRFTPGLRNVNVIYRAGRSTYPPAIVQAVKELVAHWWQNSQLRGVSLSGANLTFDTVNQEFGVSRHDGSYLSIAGVPNRVFELIGAHLRGPIIA